jgi:integrase/recombinase XerD
MKQLENLTSSIGPQIVRYIAFKRALGRKAICIAYILRGLDHFLTSGNGGDLTRETFAAWAKSLELLHAATRSQWLRVVYHFCLFRQREDPQSFVPDPAQFPSPGPRHLPYIFSENEIARLLAAAESLHPHKASPLHREVARIGIILLYTTGLRRGELARLTLGDYDKAERVLFVRRSKFEKSRLVPLSADAADELDRYLVIRKELGAPNDRETLLLVHNHGARFRGYTGVALGHLLAKVIRRTGIRSAQGRYPRVHDLRFTFAAHALLRWYRAGIDVQARLPALATYLGHVSIVSTQYYLTFLKATAEAASEQFHIHSAAWLFLNGQEGGRS